MPEMPACRSTQLDVNRRWSMLSEAARSEVVDAIDALHRAELRLHAVLYGVLPPPVIFRVVYLGPSTWPTGLAGDRGAR